MNSFVFDRKTGLFKVPFKNEELIFDSPEDMYYLYDTLDEKKKINRSKTIYCIC